MIRFVAVLLAACVGVTAAAQTPAGWRDVGLASFDEVWQTISDTFYDPSAVGSTWDAARRELRPKAESAASAEDIRRVIRELLDRLHRSHFALLTAPQAADLGSVGAETVRADVRVSADGLVVVGVDRPSSADQAGLTPGQVLLAIDDLDTSRWTAGSDPGGRRRAFELWRQARYALHGDPGSVARLRVRLPDGGERDVAVAREREAGAIVTLGNLPPLAVRTDVRELRSDAGRRVGYIRFNVWMTAVDAPVAEAFDRFHDAAGVIIDLRGNPGGLAAMMSGLAGHVIDDASVRLGRMQTRQAELEFRVNPRFSLPDGRATPPYRGPVAILVDDSDGQHFRVL